MEVKPGYKTTEIGVIPDDWEVRTLDSLGRRGRPAIRAGPFGSSLTKDTYVADGYKIYGQEQVIRGDYLFGEYFIPSERFNELKSCAVEPGDILLSLVGTAGRVLVIPSGAPEGVINPRLIRFSFDQTFVSPPFFKSLIETHTYQALLARNAQGGTMGVLNAGLLRSLQIPLPPLAEQEAIAEALSDADALIESLEQLIAKKRQIKQGAMQELLTGKKRLPGFSGEWGVRRFGEVVLPRKERIDPRRTGVQEFCIELEHIGQGSGCLVGSKATSEKSSLKSVFHSGDVLFGKLRAYLRKYWLANRSGVCSTEIWVLAADRSHVTPEYLFQLVTVDRFIEVASTAYGTHMPRSDWNVVKNYEVVLPSVEEQTAITAVLSDMDSEIAALEAKLAKASQIKQGMMHNLLTGKIRLI